MKSESNEIIAQVVSHEIALVLSTMTAREADEPLAALCDTLMKSLTLALAHLAHGNNDCMNAMLVATHKAMADKALTCLPLAARMNALTVELRSVEASDKAVPCQ